MSVSSIEVHERALRFVWETITTQGFPPTVREIGTAVGYSSPSSAAKIVNGLVRRGWLAVSPHQTRTMRVTAEGMTVVADA